MVSDPPLSVLFLWHQHQPLYKDALSNRYELPWVRLHATKDYYDMVWLLDEFPQVKANFNLVPSLLIQLDDYAQGNAQDKFIDLTLKRAADLSSEDRQFILRNFFMAHWANMVDPYKRYRELLDKRGRMTTPESLSRTEKYFKEQDWRDLQTWFNLTWVDPLWREKDAFIKGLFEKGKHFSEEEKQKLVEKHREICGLIVAKHKELQDRGQIEVTTTPFYHPILPLLCDSESARMALPHTALPQRRFQHPDDARIQVSRAMDDYQRRFGRPPQGMWPAEGSVSEEAVRLFAESGIRWIATDQAVFAHSIQPDDFSHEQLYEPYKLAAGTNPLYALFRDHELSDAIGFVYSTWEPEEAANDFQRRLHAIRSRLREQDGDKPRPHIVSVILDGENCWEYYKDDGLPFLRALYARLAADPEIETVRASDFLERAPATRTLDKLWSGSWINSNFAIWIGHSEDNRAWDLLERTRQFLHQTLQAQPERRETPEARRAWEEIYIAEGSDWFWWYGDDHSSSNDETFDFLFRKHLMNVYSILGGDIPEDLHLPIKKKRVKAPISPPIDFITPRIDGRVTTYFEWQSAAVYHTEAGTTGTMHKSENLIQSIYYGFDHETLYWRIDFSRPLREDFLKGISLKLLFYRPEGLEIDIRFAPAKQLNITLTNSQKGVSQPITLPPGVYDKVIEFGLPLKELQGDSQAPFEVFVVLQKDAREQERWPSGATFQIPYPNKDVFVENWHL